MKKSSAAAKPPKPYPTFPLFAHARGYWAKKIDKAQISFGRWAWPDKSAYEASWKTALREYETHMERRAKGLLLENRHVDLTIEMLVNAYLTHQQERHAKGELRAATFGGCRKTLTEFLDFVGRGATVADLENTPLVLQRYFTHLESRFGWFSYNRSIAVVAAMFNWAGDPVQGVLDHPFVLKSMLKKKPRNIQRRARREREATEGKRLWSPAELNAFFDHAGVQLKAMLLLAYFCAFGNTDLSDLPRNALQLEPAEDAELPKGWGVVHLPRSKTEIDRMAVIPPLVVDAVRAVLAEPREPADPKHANRVFLTRWGVPYVRHVVHRTDEGAIKKVTRIDSAGEVFEKFVDRLRVCVGCGAISKLAAGKSGRQKTSPTATEIEEAVAAKKKASECAACSGKLKVFKSGRGFYTFRHTAITYASGATDMDAMHLFEGHAVGGVRSYYLEEIGLHKLTLIAKQLLARIGRSERQDDVNRSSTPSSGGGPADVAA